jgi:hypothetical protein
MAAGLSRCRPFRRPAAATASDRGLAESPATDSRERPLGDRDPTSGGAGANSAPTATAHLTNRIHAAIRAFCLDWRDPHATQTTPSPPVRDGLGRSIGPSVRTAPRMSASARSRLAPRRAGASGRPRTSGCTHRRCDRSWQGSLRPSAAEVFRVEKGGMPHTLSSVDAGGERPPVIVLG